MIKKCLNCNKEISVKPSQYERKKYCSRECKTLYQKKNPPKFWKELSQKIKVKCSNCEKELHRKPSTISTTNFCDMECKKLYQLKNGHLINQHLKIEIELLRTELVFTKKKG